MREAFQDLHQVVGLAGFVAGDAGETKAVEASWEIPEKEVEVSFDKRGMPTTTLGHGSFSLVALGHRRDGRGRMEVAVKMASSNYLAAAGNKPVLVENFRREVRLMCAMCHPNIVEEREGKQG